jgi:four helix bundle protein
MVEGRKDKLEGRRLIVEGQLHTKTNLLKIYIMSIQSVRDLKVYSKSFDLAMEIFKIVKDFPSEEKFSLSSQIVRSSRSVSANIREGYAKRFYDQVFIRHLVDSLGSSEETRCWLEFAYQCKYIDQNTFDELDQAYSEVSAMIFSLQKNWKKL